MKTQKKRFRKVLSLLIVACVLLSQASVWAVGLDVPLSPMPDPQLIEIGGTDFPYASGILPLSEVDDVIESLYAPQGASVYTSMEDVEYDFRLGEGNTIESATIESNKWKFNSYEGVNTPPAVIKDYGLHFPGVEIGQNLVLDVYVPQTGLYRVGFVPGKSEPIGGGSPKLLIDGKLMGVMKFRDVDPSISYMFANGYIELNEGIHKLTISTWGAYGPTTNRQTFLGKLFLRPVDINTELPVFVEFNAKIDKSTINLDIKEKAKVSVTNNAGATTLTFGDDFGLKVPYPGTMPTYLAFSYVSSDTNVATVDFLGYVTPKGPGTTQITVSALFNGRTMNTASVEVIVTGMPPSGGGEEEETVFKYDFRPPANGGTALVGSATLDNSGWQVAEVSKAILDRGTAFRNQPYGIYIHAYTGEYAEFDIRVPKTDTYKIVFKGFSGNGGQNGLLQIDGLEIGTHYFGGTLGSEAPEITYKTLYLTQGVHKFRIVATQLARNMYPTWLKLVLTEQKPTFVSISGAGVSKTYVMPGNTARFIAKAQLSDGAEYEYAQFAPLFPSSITYSSDNDGIATIDGNGLVTAVSPGTVKLRANLNIGEVNYPLEVDFIVSGKLLDHVRFAGIKDIMQVGSDPFELSVIAYDTDKNVIKDLDNVVIKYSVSNPAVLRIDSSKNTITALAPGQSIVTVEVTAGQVTKDASFTVEVVSEFENSIVYDFRPPANGGTALLWDATLENSGWKVSELSQSLRDRSLAFRNQLYGIYIDSRVGEYAEFEILVPKTDVYLVVFKGYSGNGGKNGLLQVDGLEAGTHFFGGSQALNAPEKIYKTFYLTEGVHKLRLVSKEDGLMMPTYLKLVPRTSSPTFVSARANVSKTDIIAGQTARFITMALMSDGFEHEYAQFSQFFPSSIAYSSENDSIATIDGNGLVTAVSPGTVKLKADLSIGGGQVIPLEVDFNVSPKTFQRIEFAASTETMSVGGVPFELAVIAYDSSDQVINDPENLRVVYSVSNSGVLSLDSSKNAIVALAEGASIVTAEVTLGTVTKSASFEVTVVPEYIEDISIEIYKNDIHIGDKPQINIIGHFSTGQKRYIRDGSGYPVGYTSNNTNTLGIIDGKPTALAVGSATVTATLEDGERQHSKSIDFNIHAVTSSKTRQSYYTEEKIAAARENMTKYDWANLIAQGHIEKADAYLEQYTLDQLWYMVTPQSIPRSYASDPTQKLGSPITGYELYEKYGNYPWKTDPEHPWKLIDPTTGAMFPTNDFENYYKLGLNDFGIFDSALAKQRNDALIADGKEGYLVNKSQYHTDDPTWGVDDGYGWHDGDKHYTFIAYYAHWHAGWHGNGLFFQTLAAFGNAYMYTGVEKYGIAGIILLDRIADLYPDMSTREMRKQGFLNSDGGTDRGKGVGCIWECNSIKISLAAYDQLWPAVENQAAINFLSGKADQYNLGVLKKSATGIRRNIEENLVKEVFPAYKDSDIRGNAGMHQSALALAAVVYDTLPETKEWLDFNFKAGNGGGSQINTGGNILATLVDILDRDGHGDEAAPHYNSLWLGGYQQVADVLEGYELYGGVDLYENVKFRKMFTANVGLSLSEKFVPLIGDTGTTGGPLSLLEFGRSIKAFEKYKDPIYAQIAYMLNGNSVKGLHSDIFSKDPERIAEDIQSVIREYGPFNIESGNLTGYGLAALREGKNDKQVSTISYNFPSLLVLSNSVGYSLWQDSGTVQLDNESGGAGHFIEFGFNINESGGYYITLKPFGSTVYGIYDIYLNDQLVLNYDFNVPGAANAAPIELGLHQLNAEAQNTIKFVCTGTSGSKYKMGVIRLELLDEESAAILGDDRIKNTLRDLWMYYGRTGGHGHSDTLNIGIHAFGADLTPELGYPETADGAPHNTQWMKNPISHNTVVVDQKRQTDIIVADPLHFEDGDLVKLVDVRSPKSYSQTSEYRRTTAMINVDEENSYYVDFFRVTGGNDHLFSFHGAEGTVTTEGLNLVSQGSGTYAGVEVAYGANDPRGFSWLKNVERDSNPSDSFSVDWDIVDTWKSFNNPTDDVHLRLTMLTELNELAMADGIPPQNKPGNPESLRYMLAKRTGTNLDSNFVSVIEPYVGGRYIQSIEAVSLTVNGVLVTDNSAKAVKVVLKNGRTDYIVYSADNNVVYTVDGKFEFKGFFGVYTVKGGVQTKGYLVEGSFIGDYTNPLPSKLSATVSSFTKELSTQNEITVDMDLQGVSPDFLAGKYIYIGGGTINGSYRIEKATSLGGNKVLLDIGDITLVNKYINPNDINSGYVYNIAEGRTAVIPLSVEGSLVEDGSTVTGIVLSKTSMSLEVGGDEALTVTVTPDSAVNKNVTWKSDSEAIASVDQNGVVTAKSEGTATITVTTVDGGYTANCIVTVKKLMMKAVLTGNNTVDIGDEFVVNYGLNSVTQSVYAQDITIKYNQNAFDFVEAQSLNEKTVIFETYNSVPGICRFILANIGEAITQDGQILGIKFKVKENAAGTETIELFNVELADGEGTEIKAVTSNATIEREMLYQ